MQKPTQRQDPPWTILNILRWTSDYFASHGIDSPRTAAEILLADVLGVRRLDLYLRYDQPLHGEDLRRFKETIRRRVQREPVAYITGRSEIWSLPLSVSPAVLIPRPETECLVEAALALIPEGTPHLIIEPGTGSGVIALALATERPFVRILATDTSTAALDVAGRNIRYHGMEQRIQLLGGQWLEPLALGPPSFDMIVSNPPYIPSGDIPGLQPEVSRFEPRNALDGGADGLAAIRRLVEAAYKYLKPKGYLLMEIGFDQRAAVEAFVHSIDRYIDFTVHKDYSGLDRVVQMRRKD